MNHLLYGTQRFNFRSVGMMRLSFAMAVWYYVKATFLHIQLTSFESQVEPQDVSFLGITWGH